MRFVTVRAVCIACALMPLLAMWLVQSEFIWYSGHSTTISLFYHVVFPLFVIALINHAIARRRPGIALSSGELMTIYSMLCIAGTLCSVDLLQILIPMLTFPTYAANPQNRWGELIVRFIPDWCMVTDREACRQLSVGNATLYSVRIAAAWFLPLLFWGCFVLVLMLALLFINVLFRQPWTEKERLRFPVIQIPLLITGQLETLIRSRSFWIAFGAVAFIDTVNGFSFLHPSIPSIPIINAFSFRDYFIERPWSAIAGTTVNLYPFVIGLAYFLPTDLAFSCWFFFVVFKLQIVLTAAIGLHELPGAPFPNEQAAGGYLAIGLLALWLARKHLLAVARRVLGRPGGADDTHEPVRYRTAVIGLAVCVTILVSVGRVLGGTWGMMLGFFVLFFLYSLAIARMRAELGPPAHDLHAMGPDMLLTNAFGTMGMAPGNKAVFSLFFWFNRAYRAHFSAHSMEAFKVAQVKRIVARSMMLAMIIALVVGLLSAYWAILHALYVHGYSGRIAGEAFSSEAWNRMAGWMSAPRPPRLAATAATVGGAVFALFLGAMRTGCTWWVLHPVGYATATSWSMEKLWACLFIGWCAKALITRYGGAISYRKAMPVFVGMVLGEFVVGSLWGIWGALFSTPVYQFWG